MRPSVDLRVDPQQDPSRFRQRHHLHVQPGVVSVGVPVRSAVRVPVRRVQHGDPRVSPQRV